MHSGLSIQRLHARVEHGAQPLAARLALQGLAAELEDALPRELAPQAVLLLRSMQLRLPSQALSHPPDAALRDAVRAAGREHLAACAARAQRPARGEVGEDALAVLFADSAEMLACLARDAQAARLDRWWWRSLLGVGFPDWRRAFAARPEACRAALRLLARQDAVTAQAVALALGLPQLAAIGGLAGAQPLRSASGPQAHGAATPHQGALQPGPTEPWPQVLPAPPRAGARDADVLSGRSPTVEADRSGASPAAGAAAVAGHAKAGHGPETMTLHHGSAGDAGSPSSSAAHPSAVPAPRQGAAARAAPRTGPPPPAQRPDATAAAAASPGPRGRGQSSGTTAVARVPAAAAADAAAARTSSLPGAPAAAVQAGVRTAASANASALVLPPASAVDAQPAPAPGRRRTHRPPPALPLPLPAVAAEAPAADPWPLPVPVWSRHARLLLLVNCLLEDGLYPDFTRPLDPGFPLPIWPFLARLGEHLLGASWRDDLLHRALRRQGGDPGARRWGALARNWPQGAGPPARPLHLRHCGVHSLERWLWNYSRQLRLRLARRLDLPARGAALARALHAEPTCVWWSEGEIVVRFDLDSHPVAWRLAGLDRDPGYLPSAGVSLRFVFE